MGARLFGSRRDAICAMIPRHAIRGRSALKPETRLRNPRDIWAFAVAPSAACTVLALVLWWRARAATGSWGWSGAGPQRVAAGFLVLAVVLLLAAAASAAARRGIARAWMAVGNVIRRVLTFLLLTVLYFVVLPVFALIRLRDPLRVRRSTAPSFWDDHETDEPTLDRATRPF